MAVTRSPIAPSDETERENLIKSLETNLFARLFDAASRTLVLQLGVASDRGLLAGDSPEARFAFFRESLNDKAFAGALLAQHPALVRRLSTITRFWEQATLETASRLATDLVSLQGLSFVGRDCGPWTGAEGLGDAHNHGRIVQRLTFAAGDCLIYKPRPVAMERGYFALVRWLNGAGLRPDLAAVPTQDRGAYGWTRWVAGAPCSNEADVAAYFRRQGGNLAVAYLIGAFDLHYENVIAAGEYPIIVDLETLFEETRVLGGVGRASLAAARTTRDSVFRTLLLPVYIEEAMSPDGEPVGSDPSALGFFSDESDEYEADGWEASNSDTMRMAKVRAAMPAATCLPQLAGQRVAATSYAEEVVAGFSDAYDFLVSHRAELRAPGGPLSAFEGGRARRLLRSTSIYTRLLERSWHPRFAEDVEPLEADLDAWLAALQPAPSAVRPIERRALINGDVPYFAYRIGSRGGLRASRTRLDRMSPQDKARQIWIAQMTLIDLNASLPRRPRAPAGAGDADAIEMAARAIGDRLCDLAIERRGRASWLIPMIDTGFHFRPSPAGFDLYNGLAGVALCLGGLARRTRERRYIALTQAALAEAIDLWRGSAAETTFIGAHGGVGGLAWALAVLGRLLERGDWTSQAQEIVRTHAPGSAADEATDLIAGRAGFLAASVAVAQMAEDPSLLETLRPCAASLAVLRGAELPLADDAGMAHGRAGVGFALARMAMVDHDSQRLKRGLALIASDLKASAARARSDAPDGAEFDGLPTSAWCRGALGVGHAALKLGHPSPRANRAILGAFPETASGKTDHALCLCHGALGALEFLEVATATGLKGAKDAHRRLRADTLDRILAGEICADHSHRIESAGLMLGAAGTGWALLRMLEPARLPSALTLDAARL